VAISLNVLASALRANGCMGELELILRKAVSIDENVFGPDHPNVAINLNNLATFLIENKQTIEAESLLRRALTIFARSQEPNHLGVACSLGNLAGLLQADHQVSEAAALIRRCVVILLRFIADTKHVDPNLRPMLNRFLILAEALGQSPAQILNELRAMTKEAGLPLETVWKIVAGSNS
jgi:hypothetical protein